MAEFPTYEQMAKNVAEKALDEFLYDGKSIREWMKIIAEQEKKSGKWIAVYQGDEIINYRCSECELGDTNGSTNLYEWDYCRRCGAKMIELQERSAKG